jgi:hypothetical protein
MVVTEGDYLNWYNEEVSRYRDHEWRIASYSVGSSVAVLLFMAGSETKNLIEPWLAVLAVLVLVLLQIIAQVHTHERLNSYRQRRTLLLAREDHRIERPAARFLNGWFDGFYVCCFVLVPTAVAAVAAFVIGAC